ISWDLAHGGSRIEALALPNKVRVLWNRGLIDDAAELEEHLISLAHDMLDVQVLIPALPIAALIRGSLGDTRTASAYIEEWTAGTDDKPAWRARYLPEIVRFLCGTDRRSLAERSMIKETEVSMLRDRHSAFASSAVLLEAQGHLEDAASGYMEAATRWRTYGFVLEEGHALLGAGRTLLTLGDADNASESLRSAKAIFSRLGAEPLRREVDRHLRSDIALNS
ncbi:MAG: hypothetical protein H0U16_12890, partial [Actinobacteria bacterium]|nr:hypothetical protein [Actinomycetota bacterium]